MQLWPLDKQVAVSYTHLDVYKRQVHYYVSVTSRHSITRPERLETALKEHRAILESIIAGDKEHARDTIQKHIRKTQVLVRKYYAKKNQKI